MSENNKIDDDEIAQILYKANQNFEDLSAQKMDDYDKLIKRIIIIEKMHKYGSTGLDKKHKEIEAEIESFIKKED